MIFNYEELEKERAELIQKYLCYIEEKYNKDDDIIPENEYICFFNKNASIELKKWEKKRKNMYKRGIIID